MRKSLYIALLASVFMVDTANAGVRGGTSGNSKKAVRASNNRRAGGLRAAALAAGAASASTVDTTTETTEEVKDKDVKTCEQIFYTCMDDKTNETVMSNELVYSDYSDMLSDIYSGMTAPAFKCIYSNDVKSIYSKYYFGRDIFAPTNGRIEKINGNSIEYYSYLKDNATKAANKRIPITDIDREVLKITGIKTTPKGLKFSSQLPDVSYTITTIDGNALYNENVSYCLDKTQNTELEGCVKIKKSWGDDYRTQKPNISKSCNDYEVFLSGKLSKAKTAASDYIIMLKQKLEAIIDEYNLKIEAEEELKNINEKEEEVDYMTAGSTGGLQPKTDTSKKGVAASLVAGSVARKVALPLLGLPPI